MAAEDIVVQYPAVLVGLRLLVEQAAEGGDLQGFLADHDMHDLEAAADDAGAAEVAANLFRRRVGGDVEVLRLGADQQVAYRAADDIGLVTVLLQGFADATAAGTDAVAGDAVGGNGDDSRFVVAGGGFFAAEDAGNEFADHGLPSDLARLTLKRSILLQIDDFQTN